MHPRQAERRAEAIELQRRRLALRAELAAATSAEQREEIAAEVAQLEARLRQVTCWEAWGFAETARRTGTLPPNLVSRFAQHRAAALARWRPALGTLPERELRAGYAEVLKYGVLGDRGFFDWLEQDGRAVVALDPAATERAVAASVAAKARIVAEDERETSGARALLNLGHTFGHALEAETGFSDRLLHGEGVALGMVLAARYSARRGEISLADAQRVTAAVDAAGLPAEISALGLECDGRRLADHMLHDKKMDAGTLPFILLRAIGEAYLARDVETTDIAAFLDEQLQAH